LAQAAFGSTLLTLSYTSVLGLDIWGEGDVVTGNLGSCLDNVLSYRGLSVGFRSHTSVSIGSGVQFGGSVRKQSLARGVPESS
jgi:hypothetical protein